MNPTNPMNYNLSTTDSMDSDDSMDITNDGESNEDVEEYSSTSTPSTFCSIGITDDAESEDESEECKYIVTLTFDFLYSFIDDTNVIESNFISIISSTIDSILLPFAAHPQSISTSVSLSSSTSSDGRISIESTVGISSNALYIAITGQYDNHKITEDIFTQLPDAVNSVYVSSGFTIDSAITTTFEVEDTFITTFFDVTDFDLEIQDEDLWRFTNFDFESYRLYDWIVLGGCGLLAGILCCCCSFCICLCLERRKYSNAGSKINAKTGRISVFEMSPMSFSRNVSVQSSVRPTANTGFEYEYNPEPDDTDTGPMLRTRQSNYKDEKTKQNFDAIIGGLGVVDKEAISPGTTNGAGNEPLPERDEFGTVGQSYGMSGVSFGNKNALNAAASPNEDGHQYIHNQDDHEYIHYEAGDVESAFVGGPPPVTGSMVQRMNVPAPPPRRTNGHDPGHWD